MKVAGQLLIMGLAPLAVLLLAALGAPLWVVVLLVVIPAFLWTMRAFDDYLPR